MNCCSKIHSNAVQYPFLISIILEENPPLRFSLPPISLLKAIVFLHCATQYLHFTSKGKPWSHGQEANWKIYVEHYPKEVASKFTQWFRLANSYCPSTIKVPKMAGAQTRK